MRAVSRSRKAAMACCSGRGGFTMRMFSSLEFASSLNVAPCPHDSSSGLHV